MRSMLREMARRAAPAVMAGRAARYERRIREQWGLPLLADAFIAEHGDRVLAGPVAGLRYARTGDAPVAKLVGAYEQEIGPWLEEALAPRPSVFVDLGAADGYYAVGVKFRCPATRVIAFELAPAVRAELHALAALNQASVEVRSEATRASIGELQLGDGLVLCDVEGAEADVLAPADLGSCTVIVELHEELRPGVTELLRRRFSATHDVEVVHSTRRRPEDYPALMALPAAQRAAALDEHRGPTAWARFAPRSRQRGDGAAGLVVSATQPSRVDKAQTPLTMEDRSPVSSYRSPGGLGEDRVVLDQWRSDGCTNLGGEPSLTADGLDFHRLWLARAQ